MRGASELFSQILSNEGILQRWTSSRTFFEAGGPMGFNATLKKLESYHGSRAIEPLKRLFKGFEGAKIYPEVGVGEGTRSLSLRLAGHRVDVPVQTRVRGVYQMGASKYSAADVLVRTGSVTEKLDLTTYFERALMGAPGMKGMTGATAIKTRFPQLQTSDPAMVAEYMSGLSSRVRQGKMKALMTKSGLTDFSRAYFDAHRVEVPVTERMGLLLGEMQRVSERFSKRGYAPGKGPIEDILVGKGRLVEFGKGKGLHEYQQRLLGEYYGEVERAYPQYNWAGIKEGGVLPFVKDQRAASKTATHIIMSDLHPDATLKFSALGPEGKGWQDMVKAHVLASGEISRRHLGQMTPTLVEKDMVGRMQWMAGISGRPAAEMSMAIPMTMAHVDPGASIEAQRFISEYLGDSGALALSKPARELAGYGSRFRKIDVPVARFETVPELMSQLEALGPGGEGYIRGVGGKRGLSGAEIQRAWTRELTTRRGPIGPETLQEAQRGASARIAARRGLRDPKGFLGVLRVPHVGEEVLQLGADERIVAAQMIDQGTKARLFVEAKEPTKFVGGGVDLGARRAAAIGGGPELMIMGKEILTRETALKMRLSDLRRAKVGGLAEIDWLIAGSEKGSKLVGAGADLRMQADVYLSHVFGELATSRGIRQPQRTALVEALAEQMGLGTAKVQYGYRGQRTRVLVEGLSTLKEDIVGPMIDVQIGRRAPINVPGSKEALKQVRTALVRAQQKAGVLTPAEVGAFYGAFEMPRVPLAEIAKRIAPDLPQAALEEMTRKGATVAVPRHQGVFARTLEGIEKQGASGMRYRMNELMLMERNAAFARTPELKEAWGTLVGAFSPRARESAAGSEILRTFDPFMEGKLAPEKLFPTQTVTRGELAQLGLIPEAKSTVRGRLLTSEALGGVGKPTLLHTLDPEGKILLRKTGLQLRLDEAMAVTIPRLGGKEAAFGPGAYITEMQLPGLEVLGKYQTEQWRREGEMFFEGTSRISKEAKAYEAKLFGDAEQLWRQAEIYARGGETKPLQVAYQRYLTTLSQELPGKESVLARAFRDEGALSFTGQLAQYRPQPGAAKPGPLTVAVSEKWIKGTREGREFVSRFGEHGGMGFIFEYPATEQAHQIPVQVDVVKDTFFGPKLYRGDGKGVIAGTETMRFLQQRDLDFDIGMLRLLTNPKHAKAARVIHQYESKRFEAVQQMIEQVDWDNPKRQEEILRGYSSDLIENLDESTAAQIRKFQAQKTGPMSNIIRQKLQTPLAHTTIRKQGAVLEMMGRDPDAMKRALGGMMDESIEQFLAKAGKLGYSDMYGQLATVSQYAVLEKAAGQGSALESFSAYWTQTPAFVEKGRGATAEVGELTRRIEAMYTMEGQLPGVLEGIEKGNKAGRVILQGWTNDNYVAQMRSRDFAGAAAKVRKEYFEPMAEAMADLQMYAGRLSGRGGQPVSHLSTMFGPFFGQTGTLEYERLKDMQGALGQYLRWSDAGADPTQFPHFLQTPKAQRAAVEASRDPAMRGVVADALEAVNATTAEAAQSSTSKQLATTGRNIVREIWNTKAGKISMVGVGALLGYGMLKGVIGDEDQPPRTYPGGGSPLPPKPLLDTAAHQFQQVHTQIPRATARVARPEAMQTSSRGSIVARPEPAMMTVGYSSVGPGYGQTPRAENDLPEVTTWEMQSYLGHRMRSSW